MKQAILFFFFIFSVCGFAQKKDKKYYNYSFDYISEYKNNLVKDQTIGNSYILSNSNNNSYILMAIPINKDSFRIVFFDYKKLYAYPHVSKNNFFNGSVFYAKDYIDIQNGSHSFGPYPPSKYKFYELKDTIIKNELVKQYIFKPKNLAWAKNNNRTSVYYAIQPKTEFHLPMFLSKKHYMRRKRDVKIAKGILKRAYYPEISLSSSEFDLELINYKKTIKEMKIKIYKKDY